MAKTKEGGVSADKPLLNKVRQVREKELFWTQNDLRDAVKQATKKNIDLKTIATIEKLNGGTVLMKDRARAGLNLGLKGSGKTEMTFEELYPND